MNALWLRRNKVIFDSDEAVAENSIHFLAFRLAKDYSMAHLELAQSRKKVCNFIERQIKWKPPDHPFIKLNSDGSVLDGGRAACGGILRDSDGRFIACFSANLNGGTVTTTELLGILLGLELALNIGCSHLIIEADSLVAVKLCLQKEIDLHATRSLVLAIRNRCSRLTSWNIHHQFREANTCADRLAHFGHSLPSGCHIFFNLPSCISLAFHADSIGIALPRVVSI
ncbi:uncharacterized protein LOC110271646 [Arachis ipaensis]|uniref:uncharacterized protein LOC110271646 n=1 Tax=Arachis ipaensis TaxID=130454 RepID=UPI000A2B099A|nr:uncharacterized protein LOC110271646 [Arachis ipaensis]